MVNTLLFTFQHFRQVLSLFLSSDAFNLRRLSHMENRKKNIFGVSIALILPVILLITVPILLNKCKLDRKSSQMVKAPPRLFPVGVNETTDEKGKKQVDTIYQKVPNYKFQTQNGDTLELDSLRGNVYVADFFFASCPGICPKLSHSLQRVQSAFIKDRNFKIVSFSVDPERDTVKALKAYADLHDAIPGTWYFLRGSHQDIFALADKGFHITAKEDEDGGPEAFVHSEKLVLVDPRGVIRGFYSGVDSLSVNKLQADIVLVLREAEGRFSFRDQKKQTKGLFEN